MVILYGIAIFCLHDFLGFNINCLPLKNIYEDFYGSVEVHEILAKAPQTLIAAG